MGKEGKQRGQLGELASQPLPSGGGHSTVSSSVSVVDASAVLTGDGSIPWSLSYGPRWSNEVGELGRGRLADWNGDDEAAIPPLVGR